MYTQLVISKILVTAKTPPPTIAIMDRIIFVQVDLARKLYRHTQTLLTIVSLVVQVKYVAPRQLRLFALMVITARL